MSKFWSEPWRTDVIDAKESRKSLPWAVFHAKKTKWNFSGWMQKGHILELQNHELLQVVRAEAGR